MDESTQSKKLLWTGRVISTVVMLPFIMGAVMSVTRGSGVLKGMQHMGFPESLLLPLGLTEALCVLVYAIPKTAVLGAILFTGYMGGAILTHLRIGEPFYAQIIIGMLIWLGIYLREPRLRAVLPIRRHI